MTFAEAARADVHNLDWNGALAQLTITGMRSANSGSHSQYENVTARRRDKKIGQANGQPVRCKSVDDPENCLRGGDGVGDNAEPTHGFQVTSATNRSPKLWSELTDVDDGREIADEKDHCFARDLDTTMTMSELITKLTQAAATIGIPLVPIP
jgi:hypothetical protein